MPYTKTAWKDHIKDSQGNIVQQGTPLNAKNLLHIEEGLANAMALTAGELGAAAAHSGFIDHVGIHPAYDTSLPTLKPGQIQVAQSSWYSASINAIGLSESKALIMGHILPVKSTDPGFPWNGMLTRIALPEPPIEGTRDDLVFLEAWRDQATQAWKYRFRVVSGVDFAKYPVDGFLTTEATGSSGYMTLNENPRPANNGNIMPQGGNAAPVILPADTVGGFATIFQGAAQRTHPGNGLFANQGGPSDFGLYVAGNGNESSKALLKTYDGYVYAIPVAKVSRRNTGGYSVTNPNGARNYYAFQALQSWTPGQNWVTVTGNFPTGIQVGDLVTISNGQGAVFNPRCRVRSIVDANTITVFNTDGEIITGAGGSSNVTFNLESERPDGLYANIIATRDVTDLRHKTHLIAPSYEQLLIDGTDQILRGASQVERKTAMRKTYVGVRKTPLDANHVFYASFDGTNVPEVGTVADSARLVGGLVPGVTGGAARINKPTDGGSLPIGYIANQGTFDAWFDSWSLTDGGYNTDSRCLFSVHYAHPTSGANYRYFDLWWRHSKRELIMASTTGLTGVVLTTIAQTVPKDIRWTHVRLTWDLTTRTLTLYVNGSLVNSIVMPDLGGAALNYAYLFMHERNNQTYAWDGLVCDVSISKVNRGAAFANLPSDFIAGYADVMPALNYQRRINSDAPTAQKSYAVAKVKNQTQERGVTVTKGSGVNTAVWEAGDKIKVMGLAGEIISGVIDADTALTKINSTGGGIGLIWQVDDLSKIAVNDTIRIWDGTVNAVGNPISITAIDAQTKTVSLSTSVELNNMNQYYLVETTASTSSPVVRTIISGTSTTVPGTWTALGTNEAEVTLGSLPAGLAAQEIIIEYSLNMPAGQGGLYQVYTTTRGGEANGKKLIVGSTAVKDDFADKITGNTSINPHKAYSSIATAHASPSATGTEFSQADYDAIKVQDSSLRTTTTTVNGGIAQNFFTFDIIRLIEDKFGAIPGAYTTTEKVAWIVANVGRLVWWAVGNGTSPAGSKVSIYVWNASIATPGWTGVITNTTGTVAGIWNAAASSNINQFITTGGLLHVLVCADASDGVTPSTLYVDNINITLDFNAKMGYDALVPENARRDAGLGSILYVRRTTREVESLFPGNDEDNGIFVLGDYLPMQDMATITAPLSDTTDVLLSMQGIVSVAGTNKAYGDLNSYSNAIARLMGPGDDLNYKVDPQSLMQTSNYVDNYVASVVRYTYADSPNVAKLSTAWYTDDLPEWCKQIAEFLFCTQSLVTYNGELLIRLQLNRRSRKALPGLGGGATYVYFRLPGRPLIKL